MQADDTTYTTAGALFALEQPTFAPFDEAQWTRTRGTLSLEAAVKRLQTIRVVALGQDGAAEGPLSVTLEDHVVCVE